MPSSKGSSRLRDGTCDSHWQKPGHSNNYHCEEKMHPRVNSQIWTQGGFLHPKSSHLNALAPEGTRNRHPSQHGECVIRSDVAGNGEAWGEGSEWRG